MMDDGTIAGWLFRNRETGRITIAQLPNWPLWGIAVCWVAGLIVTEGSPLSSMLAVVVTALWLYWGADELVRGVNPWRRLLGAGVLIWQVAGLLV